MNKEIFLHQLRIRLSQLPEPEIQTRLEYYNELIEDMVEEGMDEEAAVASFGDVNDIAEKIMQGTPLSTLVKSKVTPKNGWSTTAIILAIVGSPFWVPLLFAFIAVIASVYIVIWSLIVSIFAVVLSLGVLGVYLLIKSFWLFPTGLSTVIFTVGCGFGFAGLCLLAFLGAKEVTIGLVHLTKWIFIQIKSLFIKKEAA